jgi:hypothetical protein
VSLTLQPEWNELRLQMVLEHLQKIRIEIQAVESNLIRLQQVITPYLPVVSSDEAVQDEVDPATYLHSSIGCWLRDQLSPLLREVSGVIENPRGPHPGIAPGQGL